MFTPLAQLMSNVNSQSPVGVITVLQHGLKKMIVTVSFIEFALVVNPVKLNAILVPTSVKSLDLIVRTLD